MFIETEKENVYHIKKRGVMMRVKVSDEQYKTIIKILTNINNGGGAGGGGGGEGAGTGVARGSSSGGYVEYVEVVGNNVRNKKKKGFFSLFACFGAS